ncbi:MAG: dienelactone hydrolase [Pseudomonadota bacterium]
MTPQIRAFYRACAISDAAPPFDRITLKVFFPALAQDSAEERNTGVIPADPSQAPFPVVVFMPGINLGLEGCSWLGMACAERGMVAVTYSAVTEEMPGYVSLSPGLLLERLAPQLYGSAPSCSTLQPILDELKRLNEASVLAGLLDLDHIVLGGHSAGGTAALVNANPDWFPGVCGVFSYAAHSGASVALGWPAETILPLPGKVPTLILGGDRDGVIAGSAHRYGRETGDACSSIRRTFDEGAAESEAEVYLGILAGANHFSFAHGHDGTTGRAFLDWDEARSGDEIRRDISALVIDFIKVCARDDQDARASLLALLSSDAMTEGRWR